MSYISQISPDNGTTVYKVASGLYGICTVGQATVNKTVQCADFNALVTGVTIHVKMSAANTAANPTLDVNSTGAIAIKRYGTTAPSTSAATSWNAGSVVSFTYDGTYWQMNDWLNNNDNTYDRVRVQCNAVKAKSAIVAANIIVGDSTGYWHLNTGSAFDISYPILYAGSAIAASASGNNNYLTIPFTVTTTQSITLTGTKAVYIKGKLAGSIFTPVSTTPLVQTLPTNPDGYQYIFLGVAYSGTAMYLFSDHPIFEKGSSGASVNMVGCLASYPLVTNASHLLHWNTQLTLSASANTTYTLPAMADYTYQVQEIRLIITFSAANLQLGIKAPSGVALTDGTTTTAAAGTLTYTGLKATTYEVSVLALSSSKAAVIMKEW